MNFSINGRPVSIDVDPERSLLSVLREELHLTGSKYGCGEGQCGACTVLMDGKPVRSCITPLGSVGARRVVTIEGLAQHGQLTPLQMAFIEIDALQCGYCTSGMVIGATALLNEKPHPTREQIAEAMEGHVCRCGTYARIVRAIEQAANGEVHHG